MPTTKKRINISLPNDMEEALARLSRRDRVPQATKATNLIRLALEIEEDRVWDEVASGRDTRSAKFVSHDRAWR